MDVVGRRIWSHQKVKAFNSGTVPEIANCTAFCFNHLYYQVRSCIDHYIPQCEHFRYTVELSRRFQSSNLEFSQHHLHHQVTSLTDPLYPTLRIEHLRRYRRSNIWLLLHQCYHHQARSLIDPTYPTMLALQKQNFNGGSGASTLGRLFHEVKSSIELLYPTILTTLDIKPFRRFQSSNLGSTYITFIIKSVILKTQYIPQSDHFRNVTFKEVHELQPWVLQHYLHNLVRSFIDPLYSIPQCKHFRYRNFLEVLEIQPWVVYHFLHNQIRPPDPSSLDVEVFRMFHYSNLSWVHHLHYQVRAPIDPL